MAGVPIALQLTSAAPFDVRNTKGHDNDVVLFSKWNSFSRVGVYDRVHGDWSLSPRYDGPKPESRFMDIDSAASTPILRFSGRMEDVGYLAVRADRARLPAPARHRAGVGAAVQRARHRARRRARPALGAALRRGARGRRRDQPDHRERRHARRVRGLLRPRLHASQGAGHRGRRPQLRAASRTALRRHPGLARGHVGRHRGRRLHAQRELALHGRGLHRLLRPPHRHRHDHRHALGLRRPAPRVARAGGVRAPRSATPPTASPSCSTGRSRLSSSRSSRSPRAETAARPRVPPTSMGFTVLYAPDDRRRRAGRRVQALGIPRERMWNTDSDDYARLILADDRDAVLRGLQPRRTADDRRPAVLLPHDAAARSVRGRVRPHDALRQRPERAA